MRALLLAHFVRDYPDETVRRVERVRYDGQASTELGLWPVTTKTTRLATETAWSAIRS